MKIGFVVPVLNECDIQQRYSAIEEACKGFDCDFEVIFAFNSKLNAQFSRVRTLYIDNKRVCAFKVSTPVNEHKLIAIALKYCEDYDATIIYSAKETINVEVIKTFLYSWKAGNKIVYLKKVFAHPKKLWVKFKHWIYKIGMKMLGLFKDFGAETDIQLLDCDVVKTINQVPAKSRQLRVLDSFIGYNYDIIKMEVDSKTKDSKMYVERTKSVKRSALGMGICTFLFVAFVTLGVLTATKVLKLGVVWHITWWFASVCSAVLWLIYYTRHSLGLRVGDNIDEKELRTLENSIEKYNF